MEKKYKIKFQNHISDSDYTETQANERVEYLKEIFPELEIRKILVEEDQLKGMEKLAKLLKEILIKNLNIDEESQIVNCPYCNEKNEVIKSVGMRIGGLKKGFAKCDFCEKNFELDLKDDILIPSELKDPKLIEILKIKENKENKENETIN